MNQVETFDIPSYEGKYTINTDGVVYNISKNPPRRVVSFTGTSDVQLITLYKDNAPKTYKLKNILGACIFGKRGEKYEIRLKDEDESNVTATNLELDIPEDLPGEAWKPIHGTDGKYSVSNLGRVRREYYIGTRRKGTKLYPIEYRCRLVKVIDTKQVSHVRLHVNNEYKTYTLAQLVATHFLDNPNNNKLVYHLDGNCANNNVSNLRWGVPVQ